MEKRINLYFYGEPGVYNEYSPAYICNKESVPEILYMIAANEPFSICREEIIHGLNIDEHTFDNAVSSLNRINAITVKDNKYKLNFAVFLERDIPLLDEHFLNIGRIVGEKIIERKQLIYEKVSRLTSYPYFSKERLLYHVICDRIFDNEERAFNFFNRKNIFSSSKLQPGNRDYLIFGYEDSEKVESHSNRILCSSNNFISKNFDFNSFGDSEGIRKDMFRLFRQAEKILDGITPFADLNLAYIKLIESENIDIAEKCGELIWKCFNNRIDYLRLSSEEKALFSFLSELGYLNISHEDNTILCSVPVFQDSDDIIIDEISEIILNDICYTVKSTFENFEKGAAGLTPVRHEINMKETAVELWHQAFGYTNEYLAEKGFVQSPEYKKGEGRYLQSFSIFNKAER